MTMLRWGFVVLIGIHALIHLMGVVKAFGWAKLPQLSVSISPAMGVLWLLAAVLILATVVSLWAWPSGWWALGAAGLVVSQITLWSAWNDAKFGMVVNIVLLIAVVYGLLTQGPWSFRAAYQQEVAAGSAKVETAPAVVTEGDLKHLPNAVQRYLKAVGVVGQPRVLSYQVTMKGRIRGGPNEAWMDFEVHQQSFAEPPTRLFLMDAAMKGLPVQAFHRFVGGSATMQVKLAGVATIVDAKGPEMDRSETVTVLNDMCLLAPATLLSPDITWEDHGDQMAKATWKNQNQTVKAVLYFNEDGLLTNFVSEDRARASRDGKTFTKLTFSTPVKNYRQYGQVRLASYGEARWHAPQPEGEFVYGEFEIVEVEYNGR